MINPINFSNLTRKFKLKGRIEPGIDWDRNVVRKKDKMFYLGQEDLWFNAILLIYVNSEHSEWLLLSVLEAWVGEDCR